MIRCAQKLCTKVALGVAASFGMGTGGVSENLSGKRQERRDDGIAALLRN
jgi:hypothetical protein